MAADYEVVAPDQKKMKDRDDSGMCQFFWLTSCNADYGEKENCEEDNVNSWIDCDADYTGFQLMNDEEITAQVRKPNSDDDNSESDEDEVIKTSDISNSDAFECSAKGLICLEI
ncbi:hypothetical protein AVEN_171419-1 [Araneus ventricosus]|uniref:Uncharacterized protein n=1 Tax=Araneus ventricosus TaxID=182803 RepID=A0A4Y2D2L2_ARAVE|nr:hypothetical protein AVEN_171419-1 [Araneus ventricosus]